MKDQIISMAQKIYPILWTTIYPEAEPEWLDSPRLKQFLVVKRKSFAKMEAELKAKPTDEHIAWIE